MGNFWLFSSSAFVFLTLKHKIRLHGIIVHNALSSVSAI